MTCAVDTSVLVDLFAGVGAEAEAAAKLLAGARSFAPLVISGSVHAELRAGPGASVERLDGALQRARIDVDWIADEELWRTAGAAFNAYSSRRRKSGGGPPRRLLTDFIIGAHALSCGALLTRDRRLYAVSFPRLRLISG
ncbi:MAG: type II toxin-antitoxin system VapC family toxin [Vulcanimicrobiaceae bacterium]